MAVADVTYVHHRSIDSHIEFLDAILQLLRTNAQSYHIVNWQSLNIGFLDAIIQVLCPKA